MIFEDFKAEIEASLGGNLIDVELTNTDYQLALKKAMRKFKQHGHNTYRRLYMAVEVVAGTRTYTIPDNVEDGIKVIRPSSSSIFNGEDLFVKKTIDEMLTVQLGASSCQSPFMLEYEMVQGKLERLNRLTAFDVDFQIDKFKHQITFFNTPTKSEIWLVECYENLEEEEYMEIDWIQRWALSECMIILGTAYRKFQTLSSPDGSTSLSGSEYINDGKELQRELMESIDNLTDGAIDYYGIYIG